MSVVLQPLLKQHFGYDTFRPLQEEIIQDALAGRDVLALLPTGGGKSLCFQLPALALEGLTVVVSPLIALMKDQVDALQAAGIAATFLNSSLGPGESRERLRGLHRGSYRLLYVAPERLLLSGFIEDLMRWNVALVAVDEAHCISEWGHDFRPEYRQLAGLRDHLPAPPFMALTATATQRVRQDILTQLRLRNPRNYVASFNRPNLTYKVVAKSGAYEQTRAFVRQRLRESGIVYCQSRKTAESVAERLRADGVAARAYHAGLDPKDRASHQEQFLRDDVRVICATVAFGMGINKPNVRFVVHYDLPKNIEGYYQETGRAGRDGLPSECLLLFSPGDVVKQSQFIEDKTDPTEQHVAKRQLQQMVHLAETSACRRRELLAYFGERFEPDNCAACDNCLNPRQTFDGTVSAQKFLSCIHRIRERSGFNVGMNHIVEVLTGADTEKIRNWGHTTLSTYGIGSEFGRSEWGAIGRELIRLGYASQDPAQFNTVELTEAGRLLLRTRSRLTLTQPTVAPTKEDRRPPRAGEIACDEALFDRLRTLRRKLADERDVPAYIVFSDVTLRQMARRYPTTEEELAGISGVGEAKRRQFGAAFVAEINRFLSDNARQRFSEEPPPPAPPPREPPPPLGESARETLQRFTSGQSVAEIADARGLAPSTIHTHLVEAMEAGEPLDLRRFATATQEHEIVEAAADAGWASLSDLREALGGKYGYELLRMVRAARTRAESRG